MRVFDEWWYRKGTRRNQSHITMKNPGGMYRRDVAKMAWKAALKWVLKLSEEINKDDHDIMEVDIIKRELNEE